LNNGKIRDFEATMSAEHISRAYISPLLYSNLIKSSNAFSNQSTPYRNKRKEVMSPCHKRTHYRCCGLQLIFHKLCGHSQIELDYHPTCLFSNPQPQLPTLTRRPLPATLPQMRRPTPLHLAPMFQLPLVHGPTYCRELGPHFQDFLLSRQEGVFE